MESCSLHPLSISSIPTSACAKRTFFYGQAHKFPGLRKNPSCRNLRFHDFRARTSGTAIIRATGAVANKADSKDENIAFVAGATGKVGSRTVRELLKLGFRVKAGVRSAQKAGTLLESVKQMKLDPVEGTTPVEKLEIVECDLEKPDTINTALGNASIIICCIGASEKEVLDITGPCRIDYQATRNLVDAATSAKVNHFILVSSLGTNKFGFPAAILNLFWGVLCWKRKAEEALIASGVPYTIVRPGGMERPTDAYKETHNTVLYPEDTKFGGQVSNLQVAELMACMAKNLSLSHCKVVEVIAETTAPLTPLEQLLEKIPSKRPYIYSPKESDDTGKPAPAPVKDIKTPEPTALVVEESAEAKTVASRPLSPYAAYENLKPPIASTSSPPSEPPSIISGKEPLQVVVKKTRPQSPFASYDDLKPPTSPSPSPPVGPKEINLVDTVSEPPALARASLVPEEVLKERPLSPYYAYEDLKPPTSPSPTPSGPKEAPAVAPLPVDNVNVTTLIGSNDVPKTETTSVVEKDPAGNSTYRSPYYLYDDLKPPTSPSPSAPRTIPVDSSGDASATLLVNITVQSQITDEPSDTQHENISRPRPLSPYAMYEDLKPPTSPVPRKP